MGRGQLLAETFRHRAESLADNGCFRAYTFQHEMAEKVGEWIVKISPLSPSGPLGHEKKALEPHDMVDPQYSGVSHIRGNQPAESGKAATCERAWIIGRETPHLAIRAEGVRRRSDRYAPHEKLRLRPHLRSIRRATDREIAIKSELQPGHAGSSGKLPVREPLQERGAGNRFLVRRREGGNAIARRRFEPRGEFFKRNPEAGLDG